MILYKIILLFIMFIYVPTSKKIYMKIKGGYFCRPIYFLGKELKRILSSHFYSNRNRWFILLIFFSFTKLKPRLYFKEINSFLIVPYDMVVDILICLFIDVAFFLLFFVGIEGLGHMWCISWVVHLSSSCS